MLKTEKILVLYKGKQIKLIVQMDYPESSYSEQEYDEELKGILIMQIQGNKKDLFPVINESDFQAEVKKVLTRQTKSDIIHLPDEAWPQTWDDWEVII